MSALEPLLRRERAIVAAVLALLLALAWAYLWRGAGMDGVPAHGAMSPSSIARPMQMPGMSPPDAMSWAIVLAMWWVMMVAMMLPGAAPIVLLYGRVLRHAGSSAQAGAIYAPTAFLVVGYLAVWFAFSGAAAAIQIALQHAKLLSASSLSSSNSLLSAFVLIAAGAYQLSPLKHACLAHCRGPVAFLTRHWRPGRLGALAMGARHGIWCLGCCWMLMALLFVVGIMNIAWIALLALLVLAEKALPHGVAVARVSGAALIAWGIALLAT